MHGSDAARSGDPLRDALELVRRQDAEALQKHPLMPSDAEELFARVARADASPRTSVDGVPLESALRAELRPVTAPPILDARVQEACATVRESRRSTAQRILRFAPWIAASVAAAAVVIVLVQPGLFGPSAASPRLVLRVVDAPLDTRFDGRALFHARKSDTRLDDEPLDHKRGEGR